jgi:hypothetical protein
MIMAPIRRDNIKGIQKILDIKHKNFLFNLSCPKANYLGGGGGGLSSVNIQHLLILQTSGIFLKRT